MDARQFDTFTRIMAQRLGRREGLAAAMALLLAFLAGGEAISKKNGGKGGGGKGSGGGKGGGGKGRGHKNKNKNKNKKHKKKKGRGGGRRDCNAIPLQPGADLHECDLREHPGLASADFTGAKLEDAILTLARLEGVSFRGARLWRAKLDDTILTGAKFDESGGRKTDIFGVDFRGADLTGATLNLNDVLYAKYAIFCQTKMPNGDLNSASCANG